MKKYKIIVSKKDIIIPKGTSFACIDGQTTCYKNGNYEALLDLSPDNCGFLVIGKDFDKDAFEYKEVNHAVENNR